MRDQIMSDFLKALASREASPGGGATSALHVAQAAALVARCAEDRAVVAEARALSMHALRLAEKDAHAITTVSRASRDQQALLEARRGAAAEAARAAATTARVSLEVHLAGLPENAALREAVATVGEIRDRADRVTEAIRSGVALSR
jgi:formiminotetrahydrofolate cyclodeaminase